MKSKLLLIITFVASVNFLSAQTFTINNVNYQVSAGTNVDVIASPSATGDLIIPSTFEDSGVTYTVLKILGNAFFGNTNITSVTFPETLTFIGLTAFRDCTNLASFEITNPSSLTTIGTAVFNGCSSLVDADFSGVPADLSIRTGMFFNCTSLESFKMKDNTATTKINSNFFNGCTSLEQVDFTGCTSIVEFGIRAFSNTNALKKLYLGNDNLLTTNDNSFEGVDLTGATLYLPTAAGYTNYSGSAYWSEDVDETNGLFANIIGGVLSIESEILTSVRVYKINNSTLRISGLQKGKTSVKIFNLLGGLILEELIDGDEIKDISLEGLSSGICIVQLQNEDVRFSKKIIL